MKSAASGHSPRTDRFTCPCAPPRGRLKNPTGDWARGFVYLEAPFVVQLLPAMLAAARGAVFDGIPPYDLWEHPPALGKIPPHGSDAGSYLVGEVFGAQRIILLKDVDGLYTTDPKT